MMGKKYDPTNLWQHGTIHVLIGQAVWFGRKRDSDIPMNKNGHRHQITTLEIVVSKW